MERYELNSLNYDNLKNNKNIIKNLFQYKLSFNNLNYILIGVIIIPYYIL